MQEEKNWDLINLYLYLHLDKERKKLELIHSYVYLQKLMPEKETDMNTSLSLGSVVCADTASIIINSVRITWSTTEVITGEGW